MSPSVDALVSTASRAIAEAVADTTSPGAMGQLVMEALARMVGCDLGSILSAAPGEDWTIAGQIDDNRQLQRNYWRYAREMDADEVQRMAGRFTITSEVFTPRRRERLAIFQEFLEPSRLSVALASTFVIDGRLYALGLARARPTFSARHLAPLEAILPHLRAALRAQRWLAGESEEYPGAGSGGPWGLTPTQERTMSLAVRGLTNREIAALLGTSPNTVRNALVEVFKKVGVSRRSELAFMVHHAGESDPRRRLDELADQRRHVAMIAASARRAAAVESACVSDRARGADSFQSVASSISAGTPSRRWR